MTDKFDAVIIGAGIIGCATALELAKKGYRTLNVDKLEAAGAGSTINSCGNIRAYYSTWDGVAMAYESFFYWQNWADYVGDHDERGPARFRNTGSVMLKNAGRDWRAIARNFTEVGVKFEDWDLATLKDRMPMADFHVFWPPRRPEDDRFWDKGRGELEGALFTPGSGFVTDPQLAAHNIQRAAEALGAEFRFKAEVTEVRRAGGRVAGVTLQDGTVIDAPVVVNVAGPHSFVVNRLAGVEAAMKIKTRALRHEVHHVPAPEGVDFDKVGYHTNDGDSGIYFRPEVGNHILVGSLDPDCDPKHWIDDPDHFDRQVTDAQWRAQVYRLAKRLPGLKIPNRPSGLVDLYDCSDDWIPIYDKTDLPGFYVAVGTSGNQFKNAPIVGAMMAEMIDAGRRGRDQDRDPVQFRLAHTGLTINSGFYSRLREINTASSFSVNG